MTSVGAKKEKPRGLRTKGRSVDIQQVGKTVYSPPLHFDSMNACLREFIGPHYNVGWKRNVTKDFDAWASKNAVRFDREESFGGYFIPP
jgi:hypothetical protein